MNTNFLVSMIISFVYYLLIDGTMIYLYMGKAFGDMIKNIQGGSPMKTRAIPGLICFVILAFGVNYFVLDKIRNDHIIIDSLKYGLIFGLTVYAVYDLTNYATFGKYSFQVMITDILWGGILAFLVTILTKFTTLRIMKK